MHKPERCPYCNQPLVSATAVKHLHDSEQRLRRKLMAEAKADARRQIAEAKGEMKEKIALAREAGAAKARAEVEGQQSKRERALERTIEGLKDHNTELERKLEGLTAPERGEMNEEDIAKELEKAFPDDVIKREGKGGDIVQVVRHRTDHQLEDAGVILYECKDHKRWSNKFLEQIKADGRTRRTPYLVLVSEVFPAKESDACVRDDVVIVDPGHVRHLARVLRRAVLETHSAELAGQDRDGKTERLYEYLRGEEFRQELVALVQAGTSLTEMLNAERRSHERDWSKRQKTYDELLHNSVAIEQSIKDIIEADGSVKRRRPTAKPSRASQRGNGRLARV